MCQHLQMHINVSIQCDFETFSLKKQLTTNLNTHYRAYQIKL